MLSGVRELEDMNIYRRLVQGEYNVHRGTLMLYMGFATLVFFFCFIYLLIFMGNAARPEQEPSIWTGTIHYFVGILLVLFGLVSKGMWKAVSKVAPDKSMTALAFILMLNLGYWGIYFVGMYIGRIWQAVH